MKTNYWAVLVCAIAYWLLGACGTTFFSASSGWRWNI